MRKDTRTILYIQHCSEIGGASWCLFELIRHLPREEYSIHVLLSQQGPLVERLQSLSGVEVVVDQRLSPISPLYSDQGVLREVVTFARNLLAQPKAWWATIKHCRRIKPYILHLNSSALFFLAFGAKIAGVPRVLLHNREHWWAKGLLKPKTWLKDVIVSSCVDHILAIADTTIDCFGFRGKSTVVHDWPSFDDESEFDVRREHHVIDADFLVLLLGGYKRIKGTARVLESLSCMDDLSHIRIAVLGCAVPTQGRISRLCSKLGKKRPYHEIVHDLAKRYSDSVVLLPSTLRVKAYMQASDVIVCPFQVAHAAKAALEAGELGKPVIISDNGEGREYVKHLKTGIVVDSSRAEDFAAAITFLRDNPDVAVSFGNTSRDIVAKEFNAKDSIRKIEKLYSGAL